MSVHPENVVYLTTNLPNIDWSSLKFELISTIINFEANTGNPGYAVLTLPPVKRYAFSLEIFSEILSTKKLADHSCFIILRKKEKR
ncbi:hypothetical protein BKA83DRAFT_4215716, partial [Pisolithus microcarpus]